MSKSNFADFMEGQEREPRKGMEIDADVMCQVCHTYVDRAEYFHSEKVLRWVCPQGHTSFIEEFKL